jgi:glycosyltransferase involved in cell wall biosynthesis
MRTLILAPWPVYPATTGGTQRIAKLAEQLDQVTIFALSWDNKSSTETVGKVTHTVIPAGREAITQAQKLFNMGVRTYDPLPMLTRSKLAHFQEAIDEFDPDLIVLEHPWLVDFVGGRPYVYDAHNCESVNAVELLGPDALEIDMIRDLERRAVQGAEHLTYCSEADLKAMRRNFPFDTPATHIPNGCDPKGITATKESNLLFFLGSMYGPNVEAARNLINLAEYLPDYRIIIGGKCSTALGTDKPNVTLLGELPEWAVEYYMSQSFAFVNLMDRGSGTHLKLAHAMSYGLPVITSRIGARGWQTPITVDSPDEVIAALKTLKEDWERYSEDALREASTVYWTNIGKDFRAIIKGDGN